MHRFYVSPLGDDGWTGTVDAPRRDGQDGPFATLTAVRDAIRKLKRAEPLTQPVEVLVRDGLYASDQPFRLRGADSGTKTCPITYRAYPNESPTLSGGRSITGWRAFRDGIFAARQPVSDTGPWFFRQLFCNGRRMTRSRYPKRDQNDPRYGGWAFIESLVDASGELDNVGIHRLEARWSFRVDPDRIGEAERWFDQQEERDWSTIQINATWQQQGHAFQGHAWYRTVLKLPESFDTRKHLWLVFGGVDKGAHVYLDGKKVLEHTIASTGLTADEIWDKPFKLDVRPLLVPGKAHRLSVKVESEFGGGGIFKPASLLSADREVDLSVASGDVQSPSAFRYAEGTFPRRWDKPQQAEVFVVPGKCWISDIIPIRGVDRDNRVIHLTRPVGPSHQTLGSATHLMPGNRFYVENNLEDLTEPGEWCLDTDTKTIYFRPPQGVDIRDAHITAPCTERLIEMIGSCGDEGRMLSHVTIQGLRLTQTQVGWPTPQSYYKTPNAGTALYMENTRSCSIKDNTFDAVGGDAIRLQNHNADNRIIGNHIKDIGAYGIFVASLQKGYCRHDPSSGDIPSPSEWHRDVEDRETVVRAWPRSTGHLISENHIHDVGLYEKHAQGIAFYGVSAPGVIVSHNHIHHIPRFGIGLMSGFGRVIVEHNHLHDLSLETCDTGGITANRWYTYEEDAALRDGPIIRYNRIFDVVGCGAYGIKAEPGGIDLAGGRIWTHYYSWGIYFDNAPMNVEVYGNITAGNTLGGLMISHYARNVHVHDNIFLDSSKSQLYFLLGGEMSGLRIERNIFSYSNPDAAYVRLSFGKVIDFKGIFDRLDDNLLDTPNGAEPTFSGLPAEALQRMEGTNGATIDVSRKWWAAMGFDTRSIHADPCFVNAAAGDYRLRADSPALLLFPGPACR